MPFRSSRHTAAVIGFAAGAGCATPSTHADLIITNAAVYTLAWSEPGRDGVPSADAPFDGARGWRPDATAIAVRDGRITIVGTDSVVLAARGPSTRVVDAQGRAVLPGLTDAHVHLANLGASLRRVDLVGVTTVEEAVRRVEERAATTPVGEWIVGYGWDEGAWANRYPDMTLLSARVPRHPVWLAGLHSFAGWGNAMAFERAGIDASTTAPAGGEIRKDASGQPTGILLNNAVRLVEGAMPKPTSTEMDARMTAALDAMARAGYTAVHDANVDSTMLASLLRLAASNRIPIRVTVMLAATDTALVERWLDRGPDTSRAPMLRVNGVKAFYDGALGSRGALLLADYADRPGHRGRGGVEYGFNESLMAAAIRRGFQVSIHAIGDAANRQTLAFFDRVFAAHPAGRAGRHRIEHAQVLATEDIPRFASTGVIASMQPGHAVEDNAWAQDRIGPERLRGAYGWRSLRQAGAPLVLSSDMPGSSYDFFYMVHSAVTRRDTAGRGTWDVGLGTWDVGRGTYVDQRLTVEEAVRGFTTWAAYAGFVERDAGVIAVGRWADLTVLDRDPFVDGSSEPRKLIGGRAVMTIVNGKVVSEVR